MNGKLEALTPDWRGATLLTAVGSVLTVDDTADFDEDGGWLTIADAAPLEYVAVDEDADTVTLAGTAGTVEAGDPVVIWDPTVPPSGAKVVEYLASVMTDRGPVDAVLEHEKIPLAGVDTLVGASVSLAEDDYGTPYVDQVLGREPLLDGSFIDPTSTIPGGQAFSLDAPTATDGYPEDYGWWQVDAAGKVLGFWRLVGGVWTAQTIVTVEALKANNAIVTALTGETITGATIQTRAAQDRGVKLGEVKGATNYDEAFIVFNESGVPFIKAVPAEELAVIAGEVKATTSTVIEGASLGGITEITRGPVTADNPTGTAGALRLTGYTTAPKSAPTVTGGYDTVQFVDDGLWADRVGWSTDGTYWYTVRNSGYGYYDEKWNSGGTLVSSVFENLTAYASLVSGSDFYTLINDGFNFYLRRVLASNFAGTGLARWPHSDGRRAPALAYDSTAGNIIIAQSQPGISDKVRIRRYTWPALAGDPLDLVGTFTDTAFGYGNDLSGVTYGTHDLGANRYIFSNQSGGQFRVVNTSGAAVDAEDWQAGTGTKVGFTYTGGAFVSMDASGLMRTYTGQDKATLIGDAALTKWVSNDLSTATLHTDQSPRAKITIKKRTKLNVTTSAINTGGTNAPDRVRVFVGQGAADPGRTAMWKQTDPAVGVISASYSSLATSGTNPVTPNGFIGAGGTVQRVELADASAFIDGVGNGSVGAGTFRDSVRSAVMGDYAAGAWTAYTPTFTATTTNPTLGSFTRSGRYTQRGKTVTFVANVICTSATGIGAGSYAFGLPVTARSSTMSGAGIGDEVVVYANQTSPNHSYIGRGGGSVTEVTLFLTATDAVMNPANSGMIVGTAIRITGTYEAA